MRSPEKIPVKTPINVIPICTVDRNLFGELIVSRYYSNPYGVAAIY
jgi:hypothetical protein